MRRFAGFFEVHYLRYPPESRPSLNLLLLTLSGAGPTRKKQPLAGKQ